MAIKWKVLVCLEIRFWGLTGVRGAVGVKLTKLKLKKNKNSGLMGIKLKVWISFNALKSLNAHKIIFLKT